MYILYLIKFHFYIPDLSSIQIESKFNVTWKIICILNFECVCPVHSFAYEL